MTDVWGQPAKGSVWLGMLDPQPWADRALCAQVGGDLWHPEPRESAQSAKRVCLNCEVRADCLDWALETGEAFGVLGGFSERERRRLKRGEVVDLIKPKPPKPPHGLTGLAKQTTERPCAHCGEEFLGKTTGKYCGPQCKRLAERDRYNKSRRKTKDAA